MTTTAATRTRFWARHSVAIFFIVAIVLGASMVFVVVQAELPSGVALVSASSASIAGIIVTALEDGRAGLRLMLNRLLIWRVGIGYWLFALLFLVPAVLVGSLVNPLFNGDPLSLRNMRPVYEIVPMFLIFFVVAGLGQELGWTGFLTPRLQVRHSALTSSAIRAILSGLWHFPLLLYSALDHPSIASFPYSGWIAQKGFPLAMGAFFLLFLLPWSIFYVWMFNSTGGSLLLVAVLHGSEVWLVYWMLSGGIDPSKLDNYWGYGTFMAVTALILVIASGPRNLSRSRKRIVHQPALGQDPSEEWAGV